MKKTKNKILKWIYVVIGSISLVLGITGIFIPLLPTTPFLLLTAFLYVRSSQKLYDKLLHNKHLGPYLLDYYENKEIKKSIKIRTLILLWITLLISMCLIDKIYTWVLLPVIGILVTIHINTLKVK